MARDVSEQNCVFCAIVAGEAPAKVVREWDDAIAIVPLNPVVPGHMLVLPRRHVVTFFSDPETSAATMRRAAEMGVPNGCSKLYGALTRAAKALGYCRAYTYTLTSEAGASLKASGWVVDGLTDDEDGWDRESRPRDDSEWPEGAKVRWRMDLTACELHREAA